MQPSAFHLTKQGASHIKKNKECQDYSLSFSNDKCAIAIVCDGHGGDDYVRSATGSKLACETAQKNIAYFLGDADSEKLKYHHEEMLKNLEASIIAEWSQSIHDDYDRNPFTEKELSVLSEKAKKKYLDGRIDSAYGTTLIAVVLTDEYWFGIHIGDGKCVAVNREGQFGQPIPWDEKCFLNATTSLCDSDALNNFRHFFSCKLPAAIFIGSDGIDDCFNNSEQLYNLYRTVLYSFATTDFEMAKADLEDYLPRLSAKGSGDDVSIAAVMDLDTIGELDIIKEYDREKEKARVEENARIEAEKAAEEKRRIEAEYAEKQRQREEAQRAEEERRRQKILVSRQKYCENCGARLHIGAKFCGSCGASVRTMLTPPPKPIPLPEEKNVVVKETIIMRGSPAEPEIISSPKDQQPTEGPSDQIAPETDQAQGDNLDMGKVEELSEIPLGTERDVPETVESALDEDDASKKENNREDEIAGASPVAD